jgi:hypothetical protein
MRLQVKAMSRGFIVIDENVSYLASHLLERNFRVFTVPKGTSDRDIINSYLGGRKFITGNSKDFKQYVPEFDIGLIAVDSATTDPKNLADLISKAWRECQLGSTQGAFILNLLSDGSFKFEDVE